MGIIPCEIPLLEFDPSRPPSSARTMSIWTCICPGNACSPFSAATSTATPTLREPDRSPPSTAPPSSTPSMSPPTTGRRSPSVSPGGAAAAAQLLDWLISYGVREIISAGSCGMLTPFDEGTFLVPCKALRDEGTSYHYAPPSRYMEISEPARRAIEQTILAHHMRYQEVVTWSTDGFFRETKEKVAHRKSEGCSVVEMECSALAACAAFRSATGGCFFIQRTALPTSSATTSGTGAAAPMNTPSPCVSTPFWPSDPKFSPQQMQRRPSHEPTPLTSEA